MRGHASDTPVPEAHDTAADLAAASVPVIGTDVPGIRDVIRHDENGLLVGAAGRPALPSAIAGMINDAPLRRRLAANGWRDVRERFSWTRVLPQYRQLLRIPPA